MRIVQAGVLVVFLILFQCGTVTSQSIVTGDKLAKIGNGFISQSEFLERYELTPGINRHNKKLTESAKAEFLYTLIAEKLWTLEGASAGLDTIEVMKFSRMAFEKLFMRDELYRREILDKIEISDEELIVGVKRNSTVLRVNFLFSENENEINTLYDLLGAGVPFNSVLAERPEFDEQMIPVEIVYGQMDKEIEDSLYKLKLNEHTSPMLTPDGWYIFKLQNRTEQILSSIEKIENSRNTVGKIIKARKEQEIYADFYYDFFDGKSVNVNPVLFESLAKNISKVLTEKKINERVKAGDPVFLMANEVLAIEQMFGTDSLRMHFILLDEKPISLKHFIRTLAYDGFKMTETKIFSVRAQLDYRTKKTIEHELLAREGYNRSLHLFPEVQKQVQMWFDNYLFQVLKNQYLDSLNATDEEIYNYYRSESKNKPLLVNVVEILTDSLEIVQLILSELNNGADINALATKYNRRESTKEQSGEYGLTEADNLGEIGRIALNMEVGDIYGPLELPEGYSVFKLIDKQEYNEPPVSFEKVKEEYKTKLLNTKLKNKMNEFTAQLAVKFGLEIDWTALSSIEVTNINSFGIRYLGFGGKITAVPLLAPNNNWVELYLKKLDTIQ